MNIDRYINQNIYNPEYLFHGSASELEVVEPRQSIDTDSKDNEDVAVFLTSWFINAAAYAFSKKLIEINEHWSFDMNNNGQLPAMIFEVENLPEDLCGYVYVFNKDADMTKDNHSQTTQYRCYHDVQPIDVVKVYYKDFSEYFKRENINTIKR